MDPYTTSLDDIIKTKGEGAGFQPKMRKIPRVEVSDETRMRQQFTFKERISFKVNNPDRPRGSKVFTPIVKNELQVPPATLPDPLTSSLEVIIAANKQTESRGPTKRKLSDDQDGESVQKKVDTEALIDHVFRPANTAYRAVCILSKSGLEVEVQIGSLLDCLKDRSHLWRCLIKSKGVEVFADSIRKVVAVAKEMAAIEFLKKLQVAQPDCEIPKYEIIAEILIDPKICQDFEKITFKRGLHTTFKVELNPNVTKEMLSGSCNNVFRCTYHVGSDIYYGESCTVDFAKLDATKTALSSISGRTIRPTRFFIDEEFPPQTAYAFRKESLKVSTHSELVGETALAGI